MKLKDMDGLRAALGQEEFPMEYIHKFIGDHTPSFIEAVRTWESRHPKVQKKQERLSQSGAHLALTYSFAADSVESVIALIESTTQIQDLRVIL